ncbi:hypothetical protein M3J07_001739 [Ascochyta lentis]
MSKAYSATETAFLIGYADYCIYHDRDYPKTVAREFHKMFTRKVPWDNLRSKLVRLLRGCGISKPSVLAFAKLGTGYLDMAVIPSNIRTELEKMRREWDLPAPDSQITVSGSPAPIAGLDHRASPSESTKSFSSQEQIALQSDANHRSTLRVGDAPEQSYSESSATDDGTSGQMTSQSLLAVPASLVPSNRSACSRGVAATDIDDLRYETPLKHKDAARAPSNHDVAARKTHGPVETKHIPKPVRQNRNAVIPGLQAPSNASGQMRIAHVLTNDDCPRNPRALASSNTIADPEEAPVASKDNTGPPDGYATQLSGRGAKKGKVIELSDDEDSSIDLPLKRQKTGIVSLESLNQKVDACFDMISNMVTNQQSSPEERSEHIHQLIRTFRDSKESIIENLIKDLESQRSLKTKHRAMVQNLVEFVDLNNGTAFPKIPAQNEIDRMWTKFYEQIVSTVGPNNVTPSPTPEGAGYLTCAAEGIANGRIPNDQLEACIESLRRYLETPHAQQSLFSALFCRWIFASPEPMLHAMHSGGMMRLYDGVIGAAQDPTSEGLARVQHYDKVATKLMFEEPDFQTVEVSRRTSEFKSRFEAAKKKLCQPSNIPSSLSPSRFSKEAIKFKQKLLLSPKEYRIHFVRPGYRFQASRMQAYDETNEPVLDAKATGKKVLLCLFPMLTCEGPQPTKEDARIEDVLCKNKKFFPTFKESMQVPSPELQLSKAVVLVSLD